MSGFTFPSTTESTGGTSIAGVSVSCYNTMETCLEACYMSCYFADHCNDSPGEMVACAPGLGTMIILTLLFVLPVCFCCCICCMCAPCCGFAAWWRNRRANRNRAAAQKSVPYPYPDAPPLLEKA